MLCITHASGLAFLVASCIAMTAEAFQSPTGRKHLMIKLPVFLAGALLPLLLSRLAILAETWSKLFPQALPHSPSDIVFLLYCIVFEYIK